MLKITKRQHRESLAVNYTPIEGEKQTLILPDICKKARTLNLKKNFIKLHQSSRINTIVYRQEACLVVSCS